MRPFSALVFLVVATCAPATRAPSINAPSSPAGPELVRSVLSDVSPARLKSDVERLAAFGTRHTRSDTTSETRGIGAARRWMKSELDAIASRPGAAQAMIVSFDSHMQPADGKRIPVDVEIVNVMAVLPGAMPEARGRRYYVMGHYDSRATDPMDATSDAPGANDDASGTAVVLELARVLSGRRLDATVVFLATAGEEQGLYGAKLHVQAARKDNLDIRAVLNNDIVGDPGEVRDRVRVFSAAEHDPTLAKLAAESDSPSRQLARFVGEVAALHETALHPMLIFRQDRFLRGGDHVAFNDAGFAAIRFTAAFETYDRQHQDVSTRDGQPYGDVPRFVDGDYLAGVARVNAATLVHLANAPSAPGDARILTATLDVGTTLRWSPSPEPDVAGYEVVWRETTSAVWQHVRDLGTATEARMSMSKDDVFFGVRAYDRDGYRSPVAFPRAAER